MVRVADGKARALVVFVRAPEAPFEPGDAAALEAAMKSPPDSAACGEEAGAKDAGARVASRDATDPLVVAGGKLTVRILLDEAGAGARHGALSLLDGAADVTVPEHTHDNSVEMLHIDTGKGTMKLGEGEVTVQPHAVVYVPEGVKHDFRGAGTEPLVAVQVYAPAGPEQRFRKMAADASKKAPGKKPTGTSKKAP